MSDVSHNEVVSSVSSGTISEDILARAYYWELSNYRLCRTLLSAPDTQNNGGWFAHI